MHVTHIKRTIKKNKYSHHHAINADLKVKPTEVYRFRNKPETNHVFDISMLYYEQNFAHYLPHTNFYFFFFKFKSIKMLKC